MAEEKDSDIVPLPTGLELLDSDNKKLCAEVYEFFKSIPQGMTAFQISNFVLCNMDFPTPDSKYWQAKLELFVRLQGVIGSHYDHRKRQANIRLLKAKIEECFDKKCMAQKDYEKEMEDAKAEQFKIEIEENEFALMNITKQVSEKVAEMRTFRDEMNSLKDFLDHSTEDKEQQEEDFWNAKAEINPELKLRFPEVFDVSRQEYDNLARRTNRPGTGKD